MKSKMMEPLGIALLAGAFRQGCSGRHAIGPLRKALGGLINLLGTNVNRRLSDIIGDVDDYTIELNESSTFLSGIAF